MQPNQVRKEVPNNSNPQSTAQNTPCLDKANNQNIDFELATDLKASRHEDCRKFVQNQLDSDARASFIAELFESRSLRLATLQVRQDLLAEGVKPKEVAVHILGEALDALDQSIRYLPGSSSIQGIEIERQHSHSLTLLEHTKRVKHAVTLLAEQSDLEEVGIEILYRQSQNLKIRKEVLPTFAGRQDGGISTLLTVMFGESRLIKPSDIPYYQIIGTEFFEGVPRSRKTHTSTELFVPLGPWEKQIMSLAR